MTRSTLSLATYLVLLSIPNPVRACPVDPNALVELGLSSISEPLQLAIYGDPDPSFCRALLFLTASELPSRSLVPRPRELAQELVPVAKLYGAKSCEIVVLVRDDVEPEADRDVADDACQRGEFRFEGDAWWTVEDDAPC